MAEPTAPAPGPQAPGATRITVRYFAAARAAAGVDSETLTLAAGDTIATLTARLAASRPGLGKVLSRCSFLVDEVAVRTPSRILTDACVVDVLPPFAGG